MIPLKIEILLSGRIVEQDGVEYKTGWNPEDTIHTICAFANDYSNVNGGYIVIGVESVDGIPKLPPVGVPKNELDKVQQEIFQYCNMIEPRYVPKIEVVDYRGTGIFLLYLKCSAGDFGPYQAPEDVYTKEEKKTGKQVSKAKRYWIRVGSVTARAKSDEISELYDKQNAVPYDDRVNRTATIDCIRRAYLEDFIRESNSSLVNGLNDRSTEDLLLSLEVANETDDGLAIRNIGVLMFAERPDKFIPCTQIDLVHFKTAEAEGSDEFTEKTFRGPIHVQVRDAMHYIDNTIITKKVVKIEHQMESESFYPYPYSALEEALVNAVFHKSYRDPDPVEIRIYVDYIQILNYPGPARWIDMDKFEKGKVRSRKYRNRRIGELFQEIELTEKKSTGITKILRELEQNGSPKPEFETDPERHYMITTIKMREGFDLDEGINGTNGTNGINPDTNDINHANQAEENARKTTLILQAIRANPAVTYDGLVEITSLSKRTIART